MHQPAGTQAAVAAAALRANPTRPYIHFESVAGNPHLFYGVRDRADGVLLLDLSLERERATIGRFFGQSYLSMNAVGYFLMALLLFGAFSLRYYLRSLIAACPRKSGATRSSRACAATCTAAAICCRGCW